MNIIEIIRARYDSFTNSEKRIGNYILDNSKEFLDLSSSQIGEKTDSSGATVIRFCKKIDIEGLEKLKIEVAKIIDGDKSFDSIDPMLKESDTTDEVVKKLYSNIDFSLKQTLELINMNELEKIIKVIKRAENVYIYAIGASSLSAYDLYHKFNRVNKRCFFNFDADMNLEFSTHTKSTDVAIGISYSGESRQVNCAIENAKRNGTSVISIVKEGDNSLKELSDYSLSIPNNEKRIRVGAVSSKFSQMFYVDLLYLGVIKGDLDLIYDYLKKTNDSTSEFKNK